MKRCIAGNQPATSKKFAKIQILQFIFSLHVIYGETVDTENLRRNCFSQISFAKFPQEGKGNFHFYLCVF